MSLTQKMANLCMSADAVKRAVGEISLIRKSIVFPVGIYGSHCGLLIFANIVITVTLLQSLQTLAFLLIFENSI